MTDDLTAFIRARLDEDERAAQAAAEPEQWVELNRKPRPAWYVHYWADPDRAAVIADPESSAYPVVVTVVGMAEDDAEVRVTHIARHDPARVLAEVDAKRQIIDAYAEVAANDTDEADEYAYGWANGLGLAVRLLALPYAGHPDYREEWKP